MVRNITRLRSLIYIKRTRSTDDDSRKHPLKYLCIKVIVYGDKYTTYFPSGVYRSVSTFFFFRNFLIAFMQKVVIGLFSLFSRDPDG